MTTIQILTTYDTSGKAKPAQKNHMDEFKREDRYLVLKISDCNTHLTVDERKTLNLMAAKVGIGRALSNKIDLECVVVESDWPEYKPTWEAIKVRMLGNPQTQKTN